MVSGQPGQEAVVTADMGHTGACESIGEPEERLLVRPTVGVIEVCRDLSRNHRRGDHLTILEVIHLLAALDEKVKSCPRGELPEETSQQLSSGSLVVAADYRAACQDDEPDGLLGGHTEHPQPGIVTLVLPVKMRADRSPSDPATDRCSPIVRDDHAGQEIAPVARKEDGLVDQRQHSGSLPHYAVLVVSEASVVRWLS
jgi:hypothetical protein